MSFPRKLSLQLLGLDLDPTTLYKAYPWTWLLDWFSSAGSVVQNVFAQAKYSVLAEYAYVMCSEKFTYTAPAQVTVNTGEAVYPLYEFPSSMSFSGASRTYYEFKQRQAANPFGFGITFASLSAFQWSILVALGLSRGGKGFSPRT